MLTAEAAAQVREEHKAHLEAELARVEAYQPKAKMLKEQWAGCVWPASKEAVHNPETGVREEVLRDVARASVSVPDGFVSLLLLLWWRTETNARWLV